MKPLVKWSGGKREELKFIKGYIPRSYKLYIEPFVGGGALFFNLCPKRAIISDTHSELINFYKQLKEGNGKKIYELMSQYKNNEKTYYSIRDDFKPKSDIEKAFVFFYLRKTCFRGMIRYNSKGKFNIPYGRYTTYNFKELLNDKYTELLKKTTIFRKDFRYILKRFNNENNFVFLDPPYDSKFTDYGFSSFRKKEHIILANFIKNTKNKCLLVIGDTDFLKELYDDYIVDEYKKKYAFKIYDRRVANEINKKHLLIANYSINNSLDSWINKTKVDDKSERMVIRRKNEG